MKRASSFLALVALVLAGCTEANLTDAPADLRADAVGADAVATVRTYAVTIENMTTSQPLSPPIVATHKRRANYFRVGAPAPEGIRLIAEEGNSATAVAELDSTIGVFDIATADAPVHRIGGPGDSFLTLEVMAEGGARALTVATMLVCTNDGFSGLNSVPLPAGFDPSEHLMYGLDAGTEANDEISENIIDDCGAVGPLPLDADGNGRDATEAVVSFHPGISGGADLDADAHGWNPQDPVARVTIQRLN